MIEPTDAPPAYSNDTNTANNPNSTPLSNSRNVRPLSELTSEEREAREQAEMDAEDSASRSEEMNEMNAADSKLPAGWVRALDPATERPFYVEVATKRAIWVHPYDDPIYLQSIPDDNNHISSNSFNSGYGNNSSASAIASTSTSTTPATKPTFGRRLKDKLTGQTHEQRVKERAEVKRQEQIYYQQYLVRRAAAIEAQRNGQYSHSYQAPQTPYSYNTNRYGNNVYSNQYSNGGNYGRNNNGRNTGMMLGGSLLGGLLLGSVLF